MDAEQREYTITVKDRAGNVLGYANDVYNPTMNKLTASGNGLDVTAMQNAPSPVRR
jgi:hypothetical protein